MRNLILMTTAYGTLRMHFDIHSMPDFEGISRRFLQGFNAFIKAKKCQAARAVLQTEVRHAGLAKNPRFINEVVNRMDDESVLEKRFIFISLNSQALV
jgi:hypothetical protein